MASTFSPRFLAVLAEAQRVSEWFGAPIQLLHADHGSPEKTARFRQALAETGLPAETPVHYRSGNPADAILEAQAELHLDVLIAGALERETVHRNFTGDVARALLRRSPSDLFLFVTPAEDPPPLRHLYLAAPDFSAVTREAFHQAVNLGERAAAETLTVVHVQTPFAEAKKAAGGDVQAAEAQAQALLNERADSGVQFDYHIIRGNTGFTAFEYIQSSEADLLVMPSELHADGTPTFAPVLDWIIQVIPTNLWVLRRARTAAKAPRGRKA